MPSEAEWTTLTPFLGGDSIAGNKLKETGTTHWLGTSANWLVTSADVTNSSGFKGLPGGDHWVDATLPRFYFRDIGHFGYFWSSTLLGAGDFTAGSGQMLDGRYPYFRKGPVSKEWGCSVRCVKD